MSENNRIGKMKIFLTREICNSLISVLDNYIAADETNKYGEFAKKLKRTILFYGRKLTYNDEENIIIYLYEDEAAVLIKLFAIYINAIEESTKDYFDEIKNGKNPK